MADAVRPRQGGSCGRPKSKFLSAYSHTWADETYYTRIRVDPLPSTGADEFLQRFLGNGEELVPLKQHLIKR